MAPARAVQPREHAMRKTLLAAALGFLAAGLLPQGKTTTEQEARKGPAQLERERIEREIQGVWELYEYTNAEIPTIIRASGYMFIQDGWLSTNIVVTGNDRPAFGYDYYFVGTTKRYVVTDQNRLKLTDVWGFSNQFGRLTPDSAGNSEERVLTFTGPPEVGQKLRLARSSDASMVFVRRTPLPKITAPPVASDK